MILVGTSVRADGRDDASLMVERRDLDARSERDAVAAYFDLHPAHLAGVPGPVLRVMAARLEGNRARVGRLLSELPSPR